MTTVRGKVDYRVACAPRFQYASVNHTIRQEADGCVFVPDGGTQPAVKLYSDVPLVVEGQDVTAAFTLRESESACFILEVADGVEREKSLHDFVTESYRQTIDYWQTWISQSTYDGRWKEVVNRSALTLKLLFSKQYGSIIAAATFALPEAIGGARNWDYRYTWVRDAAFSMHAFLELGFYGRSGSLSDVVAKTKYRQRTAIDVCH